jgi:hypothetical protein
MVPPPSSGNPDAATCVSFSFFTKHSSIHYEKIIKPSYLDDVMNYGVL